MAKNIISFSSFFGFVFVLCVFSNLVDIATSQQCPDNTNGARIGDGLIPGSGGFTCSSNADCSAPCSKAFPEGKLVSTSCGEANVGPGKWVYNCDCCFQNQPLDFCKDGEVKNLGVIEVDEDGFPVRPEEIGTVKVDSGETISLTSTCSTDAECETKCGATGVVPEGQSLNGASCFDINRIFDVHDLPKVSHCLCCFKPVN